MVLLLYVIIHSAGIQERAGARMLMLSKFDTMGYAKNANIGEQG